MEIVTKNFSYKNQNFYIIKNNNEEFGEFYATINHEWVNKDGRLNRTLCMADIEASPTLNGAIINRQNLIDRIEFIDSNKLDIDNNHDRRIIINFIMNQPTSQHCEPIKR